MGGGVTERSGGQIKRFCGGGILTVRPPRRPTGHAGGHRRAPSDNLQRNRLLVVRRREFPGQFDAAGQEARVAEHPAVTYEAFYGLAQAYLVIFACEQSSN